MEQVQLSDINIEGYRPVQTPKALKAELPLAGELRDFVSASRQTVKDILDGKDNRLMVVTGPAQSMIPKRL